MAEQNAVDTAVFYATVVHHGIGPVSWLFKQAGDQYRSAVINNREYKPSVIHKRLGFIGTIGPADPREDWYVIYHNAVTFERLITEMV